MRLLRLSTTLKNLFSMVTFVLTASNAHALTVLLDEPLQAQGGTRAWVTDVKRNFFKALKSNRIKDETYMEVREVKEVPGAYLAVSMERLHMNRVFTRPTIISEGCDVFETGTLVAKNDPNLKKCELMPAGHDFTGESLVQFYKLVKEKSAKNPEYSLSKDEQEFYDQVIKPLLAKNVDLNKTVFVTSSVSNSRRPVEVVSHELLHAQYFLQERYRKIVDDFWNEKLDEQTRQTIRDRLKIAYDTKNEFVMRNEFQAYFLQVDAGADEVISFKDLVPALRPALLEILLKENLLPLQVR